MTEPAPEPYGSWRSPITADLITAQTVTLRQIELDGPDTYWIEERPTEGGRNVIVRHAVDGLTSTLTPTPFNVRSRVHEYGGGAYVVDQEAVYFSNFGDNRVYRQEAGAEPAPITPEANLRYADFAADRRRQRLICVREDHTASDREAVNTLAALPTSGQGEQRVLVSGNDFYSSPRLSPDGSRLCWLTWNHPNMPWDGTELWVGTNAADGSIQDAERVAGGNEESIFQPQWSPDGVLYFISDRSGYWNIYRYREGQVEAITEGEAEFGLPQWVFGQSSYGFASTQRIIAVDHFGGEDRLERVDTSTGARETIAASYSAIDYLAVAPDRAVCIASSPTSLPAIVQLDLRTDQSEVLRRSGEIEIAAGYLSRPRAIAFPTENGQTAHAWYYPPQNANYIAPPGELPPLIVRIHGGPTSAGSPGLQLRIQYWTSRGFAVLDVNYGGSTGYGRAYRQRLNGNWGVVDVDDAINGARYLAERGLADPHRLLIAGGSAGGYTTLAALAFRDTFSAGASYYGISDLDPWDEETHKFESRYLRRLVGTSPEVYRQRSPIRAADQIAAPVILFQGLDDKIVPPNQAEILTAALRAKGLPFAYVAYEGEGHGFRKAENIKRTLDGELYFYSRIFGFDLPSPVEPVTIENL